MDEFVQSHKTFDEAAAGEVSAIALLSNSEPSADAIMQDVKRKLRSVSGKSLDALKAHMEIGGDLRELKKIIGHGKFGRVVEARLGFKRGWAAQLMNLHENWDYVQQARDWAKSKKLVARSEFSVDGALRLLAQWQRATANKDNDTGQTGKKIASNSSVSKETVKRAKLTEALKQAEQRIAFLESEVVRLGGELHADAPFADQFLRPLPEPSNDALATGE
jgi:hypothetical protein